MRYVVTIEETVTQDVELEAPNSKLAMELAKEQYRKGELVLEPGNLIAKRIAVRNFFGDSTTKWSEF